MLEKETEKVGKWSENNSKMGPEIFSKSEEGGTKGCGNRDRKSVQTKCGGSKNNNPKPPKLVKHRHGCTPGSIFGGGGG
jgi:hypothetical protein